MNILTLYYICYVILAMYMLDSDKEPSYNLSKNLCLLPRILKLIEDMVDDSTPPDNSHVLFSLKLHFLVVPWNETDPSRYTKLTYVVQCQNRADFVCISGILVRADEPEPVGAVFLATWSRRRLRKKNRGQSTLKKTRSRSWKKN